MGVVFSVPGTGPEVKTLNVSNASAKLIVHELLNYGSREKDYTQGTLDPLDVIFRLTTAGFRVQSLTTETTESYGAKGAKLIDSAVTADRLERYIEQLTELAEKAIELGEDITYA